MRVPPSLRDFGRLIPLAAAFKHVSIHFHDLRIPLAGRWRLRVEILASDFDKAMLEDDVLLPRSP